jgi:TonB family protein
VLSGFIVNYNDPRYRNLQTALGSVGGRDLLRNVEGWLIVAGVALIACFPCPAQHLEEGKPTPASTDFEVKFANEEILVRRKGTEKWEQSRTVKEPIKIELPDGKPVYLITKAVTPPKAKHTPDPNFPPEAKNRHNQGTVSMHAVVDEHGRVGSPMVYASSGPEFSKAATEALQKWLFDPARLNDQPVPVLINITMSFKFYGSSQM